MSTGRFRKIIITFRDDRVVRCLAEIGYRIVTVVSVSDALKMAKHTDVVLMGDELDGVQTYDLVPVFKSINDEIQVIVASSSGVGFVRRLRKAGIFYHTTKPVDLEELKSAVECAFEKIEKEKKCGILSFLVSVPA